MSGHAVENQANPADQRTTLPVVPPLPARNTPPGKDTGAGKRDGRGGSTELPDLEPEWEAAIETATD